MTRYSAIDPATKEFFTKISAVAEKFESDIIASGRYEYVRAEGDRKIYIEKATGHIVPVLIPQFKWSDSKNVKK